ncbi:TetR/AcrR family transcriptional regulator [Micromonospora siamensis]|uniref:DNA-binding transcriptional regulator, AcrR family n=1 Tax=Micromonospora siamensis TaxID=299152 RepID=A0A1C5GKC5_9ACTN|nr:TetR/AcrR family transcriptional regulator [Micromonospora siamensis]SCG34248.1 DNA-binding transcriptional regulator, AcrR family [Micromonospora siamensis]
MPRAGLTPQAVVRSAAELADEVGYDKLTLAALAGRLGVALPSLYKHVKGADALDQKLAALAVGELADAMTTAVAGRAGVDALRAVAGAWRAYAQRHPGRYQAAQRVPDPADPEHVAAGERALASIYAILRGYGLTGDDAVDAARILRSALHGFVTLAVAGGFGLPRGLDRTFDQMVAILDTALRNWPEVTR